MNNRQLGEWRPLTEDGSVLWLKYSFGPGTANSLAAKRRDGAWVVISPPSKPVAAVMDALDHSGGVAVLVAPNAYHHLGQAEWRARFPHALCCAPRGAHPRLSRKAPRETFEPLEAIQADLLPARAFLPAGMKAPDTLFQIPTADGSIWWMGDLFANSSAADQSWPLRILARFAGSGLGYRVNSKPEFVYVSDRRAWLDSVRAALAAAPPGIIVPAHGDPVVEDVVERTRRACDAIDPRLR